MDTQKQVNIDDPEPRWPALVALLAVGGLYEALPSSLQIGPRRLLISLVVLLLVPTVLTRWRGHHSVNRMLGLGVDAVVTVFLIASVGLLVRAVLGGHIQASRLLLSSSALWLTNVLVFALWYWNLDGGGPHQRDLRAEHTDGAFLFPADGDGPGRACADRGAGLVSGFRGLPVSVLQHQHGAVARRHRRAVALGQVPEHAPGDDLTDGDRPPGRPRRQHPQPRPLTHETQEFWGRPEWPAGKTGMAVL